MQFSNTRPAQQVNQNPRNFMRQSIWCIFYLLCLTQIAHARLSLVQTIPNVAGALAVNSRTNQLFVAGTNLQVVDTTTNTVTDLVEDFNPPLALNQTTNKVYGSRFFGLSDTRILEFDATTKTTIEVGAIDPNSTDDIAINPVTNRIYVDVDNTIRTWDLDEKSFATVAVGYRPHVIAVNTRTNRIYVGDYGPEGDPRSHITVIDGHTNTVIAGVDLGPLLTDTRPANLPPLSIAINQTTNRIYVTSSTRPSVSVIDGATNQVIAQLSGPGNSRAVAVNEKTNRFYVTSAGGAITAFDGRTNEITSVRELNSSERTVLIGDIAVNSETGRIYASATIYLSVGEDHVVFVFEDDGQSDFDSTPPTLSLTAPTNGTKLSSFPAISGQVQDNIGGSGLQRVALFIRRSSDGRYFSGKNWSTTAIELPTRLNQSTFTNAFDVPSGINLRADSYFITAIAIDRAQPRGNRATVVSTIRIIDATAPQITFTYPTNGLQVAQLSKVQGILADEAGGSGPSRAVLFIRRLSDGKYFDGRIWTNRATELPTRLLGVGQAVAWVYQGALPPAQSGRDVYRLSVVGYDRALNRSLTTIDVNIGTATSGT
jgi:YVTN family beta-propeller protein